MRAFSDLLHLYVNLYPHTIVRKLFEMTIFHFSETKIYWESFFQMAHQKKRYFRAQLNKERINRVNVFGPRAEILGLSARKSKILTGSRFSKS